MEEIKEEFIADVSDGFRQGLGVVKCTNICGIDFKFIKEVSGWWSIYEFQHNKFDYVFLVQSKDLEHCYSYVDRIEYVDFPMNRL